MGNRLNRFTATVLSTALIVTMVAGATLFGAALPAAAEHPDDAQDLSDQANFEIVLPATTDHYPGDQNAENGSIEYFASGADAFQEVGGENGVWVDYIIVDASWIDYTACSTENTQAFGIDRGNNNSGTNIDEDLIEHQEKVDFRPDGITINFLDWDDIANDPPYIAPEDAIVAAQGAGSNAGPCLTVTSEPGWYQIEGFLNGTVADENCTEEGNSECQPEGNEEIAFALNSNYTYVCECENEQEAEQQLGPKPGTESTPTPDGSTPTPTATPAPGTTTATPTPGDEQTATPTPSDEQTATPTATEPNNGGGGNGGGNTTPTGGSGPGFGATLAILGLLGSALLLHRRR